MNPCKWCGKEEEFGKYAICWNCQNTHDMAGYSRAVYLGKGKQPNPDDFIVLAKESWRGEV